MSQRAQANNNAKRIERAARAGLGVAARHMAALAVVAALGAVALVYGSMVAAVLVGVVVAVLGCWWWHHPASFRTVLAARVLAAQGYERTTTNAIAAEAGISPVGAGPDEALDRARRAAAALDQGGPA
jgi:hypothetical protein